MEAGSGFEQTLPLDLVALHSLFDSLPHVEDALDR